MKKVLSFLFVSFALSSVAKAGPGFSCLWLDNVHPNPDSTYIDTCSGSSTFQRMYCRKGYEVTFAYYVIHSPVYNFDTTLTYDWTAIDTAYPAIRSAFEAIDSQVGHFTLTKLVAYLTDTSSELDKIWVIRFDSLMNVDSSLAHLLTVPEMTTVWRGSPIMMDYVPPVKSLEPGLDFSSLTPDGTTEFSRYLHPLGWSWNIYKLHCPMAWEITMGKPASGSAHKYIHVAGDDGFDGPASSNPDLTPNFIQLSPSGLNNEQANGLQNSGNGVGSYALADGHGHGCLSQAIAAGVNSMIGTCPECKGIASPPPWRIDVSGGVGGPTAPEVEWSSSSTQAYSDYINDMQSGIAVFSAAGNTVDCGDCGQNINYEPNPSNSSQTFLYPMVVGWPGYVAYIDGGSDPTKDVHPLCVGGDRDGSIDGLADACSPYNGTYFRCTGPEQFDVQDFGYKPYNFSCGLDKFSTASGFTTLPDGSSRRTRILHKQWAFMDPPPL